MKAELKEQLEAELAAFDHECDLAITSAAAADAADAAASRSTS